MRRFARFAVAGVLLAAALLAVAYSIDALHTWWVELLHYLPYPVFLLPALAAFLLSFELGWWWRAAAAVSVALVLTVLMGLAWGHADAGTRPVRVMTYNIKAYLAEVRTDGFERLAQEVAAHDPDILVMQDAAELTLRHQHSAALAASVFAGRQVFAHRQYLVVSRFPLRECLPGDMPYRTEYADYLRCVVDIDGVDVDLFVAHLLTPRRGLNAARREAVDGIDDWQQNFADRLTQARHLARAVAARMPRPMILAGDLNAAESSPVLRTLLARGLRDTFSSAGRGYGYTYGHALRPGFSFLRIDHILVSDEIGVQHSDVGGREASEHRPVIADLLLQRNR